MWTPAGKREERGEKKISIVEQKLISKIINIVATRDNKKTSFGSRITGPFPKNGHNSGTGNAIDMKSSLE